MSHYDKNYSYAEMLDAFHAGRSSVLFDKPIESGTGALEWIDNYTACRDKDLEIREIDNRVEAEQDDKFSNQETND